jgi:hypothetical protein
MIQYIIIFIGVRRDTEGIKCVMGVKNQEEFPLSFRDLEKGISYIVSRWKRIACAQMVWIHINNSSWS